MLFQRGCGDSRFHFQIRIALTSFPNGFARLTRAAAAFHGRHFTSEFLVKSKNVANLTADAREDLSRRCQPC
jgi:hypothetical protein